MRSFITFSSIIAALFIGVTASSAQHKVTLTNGDQLSGKLIDSDTEGVIFLEYPNSNKPIKLLESSIQNIKLNSKSVLADGKHKERIKLVNGDEFPISLTSLDKDTVSFKTSYAGSHTIPRAQVSGIYFNNLAEDLLYQGPNKLTNWKQYGGKWEVVENKLTSVQRGKISKNINNLTENFKIEFVSSWTEVAPNMRIYFSTTSGDINKKQDCYYMEINVSGQRLVKKTNNRLTFIGTNLVQADTYKNKSAKFEIFVDRQSNVVTLFIDGKKVKEFKDKDAAPKGSQIIFECSQRHNEKISFEDISISSWNGIAPSNNKKNAEALKKNDLIMNTSSTQMAGSIDKIVRSNNDLQVHLNIPFAKKPSVISSSKIQHILLQTADKAEGLKTTKFGATLSIGGKLSFNQSKIAGDTMTVSHPIIGELNILLSSLHEVKRNTEK